MQAMIKQYQKKPVIISAVEWTGTVESLQLINELNKTGDLVRVSPDKSLKIPTLEGEMKADIGDFIICGIKGEIYPCKPDIFKESYLEIK